MIAGTGRTRLLGFAASLTLLAGTSIAVAQTAPTHTNPPATSMQPMGGNTTSPDTSMPSAGSKSTAGTGTTHHHNKQRSAARRSGDSQNAEVDRLNEQSLAAAQANRSPTGITGGRSSGSMPGSGGGMSGTGGTYMGTGRSGAQ